MRAKNKIVIAALLLSLCACTSYRWPGTSNHKTKDGKWTFNHKVHTANTGVLGDFFSKRQNRHKTKWGKDSFSYKRKGNNTGFLDGVFKNKRKKVSNRSFGDFFTSKSKGYNTKTLTSPFSFKSQKQGKIDISCNAFMVKVKKKSNFKNTDFFTRKVNTSHKFSNKDPFATRRKEKKTNFGKGNLFGSNSTNGWTVGKGYGRKFNFWDLFKRKKTKYKKDPFSYKREGFDTSRRDSGLFPKGVMPNN